MRQEETNNMGMKEKKTLNSVLFHVVTCAIGLIMIYPLLWLFASSMKSNATMFKDAYSLIPEQFDLVTNYKSALAGVGGVSFWTFLGNTVIVTVVGVIGCVMVSLFAAYAFTRIKFKGSNFWFSCVMITMMIPSQVMVVPQYIVLKKLKPIAMVSTDNCSHNGDKLYAAIDEFAKAWSKNGVAEAGFADYVNSDKVSFTWSMIDKITPRPDANVEKMLLDDGVEGLDPVITSKNTYVAPFVNAEETEYLVIEDKFPNGREALEAGGLMFTDRETVDKVEKMKVCTCLNPLHTALAIYGCLLGYDKISEEMKDDDLRKMIEIIGYKEGLPVVVNPGILDPKKFIKTVLEVRLPNPFMPDTPQRIATDTSQKLAIRFGETIKAYMASDELEASDLKLIPLVFAGWLRYLMAVDDNGNAFEPSSDPMLAELTPYLKDIKWNDEQAEKKILPILAKSEIFGVNLAEAGLLCRVVKYFKELIAGVGAVRTTLHKYVSNN